MRKPQNEGVGVRRIGKKRTAEIMVALRGRGRVTPRMASQAELVQVARALLRDMYRKEKRIVASVSARTPVFVPPLPGGRVDVVVNPVVPVSGWRGDAGTKLDEVLARREGGGRK